MMLAGIENLYDRFWQSKLIRAWPNAYLERGRLKHRFLKKEFMNTITQNSVNKNPKAKSLSN